MLKTKTALYISALSILSLICCGQEKTLELSEERVSEKEVTQQIERGQHPYGGWFCPDNFRGFPPVDIQNLSEIPAINDRLPTQEETRNGTSLIFIDETKYPDAKPLDIHLPRLARTYSQHNDIDELIIVIQAVVIGQDTIVGFRYPTGGNGSAWYDEVRFLSDQKVNELGSSPYVYLTSEIKGNKEDIWKAFTTTDYAKKLGARFDKESFFEADWSADANTELSYKTGGMKAAGMVMNMWGNLYMHIDYDNNGFHFTEKMLVMQGKNNTSELHFVSGPYPEDIDMQTAIWSKWLAKIKQISEQ